jgi:hypothetical protein
MSRKQEIVTANGTPVASSPPQALLADNLLPMIERLAKDEQFDPTRTERLLDMLERERERQLKLAFTEAMARAQAEMQPVIKDANNQQTRSKFASFADRHDRAQEGQQGQSRGSGSCCSERMNGDKPGPRR